MRPPTNMKSPGLVPLNLTLVLLVIINFLKTVECSFGTSHDMECLSSKDEQTPCDIDVGDWPVGDCEEPNLYYTCVSSTIRKFACTENHPFFDGFLRSCTTHNRRKRQIGSQAVDGACRFNTDCLSGMFCNNGLCTCTTNYVQRSSYCYQKINPGQTGCTYQEQCSTVWFGATCVSGSCSCPSQDSRAVATRDGTVCVAAADVCPLPGGGLTGTTYYGSYSLMYQDGTTTAASCTYTSSGTQCSTSTNGGYSVAELYDCVQSNTNTANGVCCPNRALTCQMPQQTGATGTAQNRWWYNSATDACESFSWNDGGPGNSNNFQSEAHCLTYCQNRCARGHPSYSTTSTQQISLNSPLTCQTTSSCSGNYACTQIGSNSVCCPSADFVCGAFGGIDAPVSQTNVNGADVGFAGNGGNTAVSYNRYYYNTNTRTCLPFTWTGYGGNFNNFHSNQECQNYCDLVLCDRGTPLKDTQGSNQACSSSSQCPTSHSCTNNVCCPTKQTICAQGKAEGTACTSNTFVTRYYYDSVSRQCKSFTFGGCNGNANNFDTQLECDNYCRSTSAEPICPQGQAYRDIYGNFYVCNNAGGGTQCPVNYECYYDGTNYGCCPRRTYTCSQPSNQGRVCGVRISRWYYDTTTQTCQSFIYLGCDGNSNNFASRDTCESYCGAGGCPNGGDPYQESSGTNRVCSSAVTCPTNYECTNVVLSTSSAVNYCCPTRALICGQSQVSGNNCGTGGVSRYAFELSSRSCTSFTYNGCGGNGNNFETLSACQNFCNSAGCAAGEAVYIQTGSTIPLACNIQNSATCPQGYECKFDSVTNNYVCCGSTDMGVCPNLEKAYIEPTTLAARECQPSNTNPCPTNFLCRLSTLRNRYYCCRPTSGSQCPAGYAAFINTVQGLPQTCDIGGVRNSCPNGYSCQTPVIGAFEGYCCSTQPLCPSGYNVYQTTDGQYRSCQIGGLNTCPQGYQCQSTSSNSIVGYCCSTTIGTAVCGSGTPFLSNNAPVVCSPNTPSNCNSGYICQLYQPTNTYYCCAGGESSVCGTGGSVYTVGGVSQVCSVSGNECPSDYTCTLSPSLGTFYCCRGGNAGLCPNGAPYLVNGIVQTCSPGLNNCPSSYTCRQNPTNNAAYYCCSGSGNTVCGANAEPYQPGGTPVSCSTVNNRCPTGYNCQLYQPTGTNYCCRPTVSAVKKVCRRGDPYVVDEQAQTCSPLNNLCPPSYNNCIRFADTTTFFCCSSSPRGNARTNTCGNGGTLTPTTCSPSFGNTCPGGRCQFIQATGRFQCCLGSGGSVGTCPNGGTATETPCSPNVPNPCGDSSSCQLIGTINAYRCCNNAQRQNTGTCPDGGSITSTTCSPNIASSCSGNGASCQFITANNRYQCCRGVPGLTGTCPNGGSLTSRTCSPNIANNCGSGSTCQLIADTQRYQCCTGGNVFVNPTNAPTPVRRSVCPPGQSGYTNPGTGQLQQCRLGIATTCPANYRCVSSNGVFVCCRANLPFTQSPVQPVRPVQPVTQRPVSLSPYCNSGNHFNYRNTNLPLTCRLGGSSCPSGYTCQLGTGGRYFCCTGGFGFNAQPPTGSGSCPRGSPYISQGQALVCFGPSGCPMGYTCQPTAQGKSLCCSSFKKSARQADEAPQNAEINELADCKTKACKGGEYGCEADDECITGVCKAGRCMCRSNELVRPNGLCGKSCGGSYQNVGGICIPVSVFDDPNNEDLVLPSVEDLKKKFDPEKQILEEKCSTQPCKDKRSFCNQEGKCECYATYRPMNGTCILDKSDVKS